MEGGGHPYFQLQYYNTTRLKRNHDSMEVYFYLKYSPVTWITAEVSNVERDVEYKIWYTRCDN